MAIEKRVVIHIFRYLVLGSGHTQSTITLLEDYSNAGMGLSRATPMSVSSILFCSNCSIFAHAQI
jgi:hypothetical protein